MPKIFIDNQPCEVKAGQNLLHAALSSGVDVPYFCWHPALGSAGACRQCAVQIFKDENDVKGRMVMSCMTPATEGTRISVNHPGCNEFRADVIEWMMTNHPHDCPVCDEGGECHLQDMTLMTGHNYRRYKFKKRTFKNQQLGPFINHEMNRCITCYRCVRFYKDLAGGTDLGAFSSSNHVYFGRESDGTLESEFSGNLVEVCPTGVFTDKPFKHFFNRKWDLQMAPSVCQLCSVGCNIIPGERYGSLRRVQNRYNAEVNGYFLCDRGRFGHSFVNSPRRLLAPQGDFASTLKGAARVVGVGSPRASLEANFALRQYVGADNFYDGLSATDSQLMQAVKNVLSRDGVKSASVQDVEYSDSIWILGEDLTQTAARLALAVRQSVFHRSQAIAAAAGIDGWHDIAVRNRVRDKTDGVMIACAHATRLDDVVPMPYRGHPDNLVKLANAVAHVICDEIPPVDNLGEELRVLSGMMAEQLKQSNNPVIISGTGLQSPALIEAACNVVLALKKAGKAAKIALVVPESNSLGLSLMEPLPLSGLTEQNDPIDALLIVENDLTRRMPPSVFDKLLSRCQHVIVLDSIQTSTTERASVKVPVKSFAESTGTLVNYEGRIQRYYGVFDRAEKIEDAWRVLSDAEKWKTLDDITQAMCAELDCFKEFGNVAYSSHFQIKGQRVPRETLEYSGRTSMAANVTMHEPKPNSDPDSPFSHSMEGTQEHPPSSLTPFYWSPGWNSVSALNKYQAEVGGQMQNQDAGCFAIIQSNGQPSKNSLVAGKIVLLPRGEIFGSEERASYSLALSKRIAEQRLELSERDAQQLQLREGQEVGFEVEGKKVFSTLRIRKDLCEGVALWAAGLPGEVFVQTPSVLKIERARTEA